MPLLNWMRLMVVGCSTLVLSSADTTAYETAASTVQDYPYYDYDGSWTFVRIRTSPGAAGGFSRFGRSGRGWAHDYPDAEINVARQA